MTLLDDALAALAAGLNVVPVKADGSKRPDLDEWVSRKTRLATEDEIRRWFGNGRQGLGVICGQVSGGLEMLEFEGRAVDDGIHAQFVEAADALGLAGLLDRVVSGYLEETPSGGLHLLYRCEHIDGNLKLARRPGPEGTGIDVLIETRGEGGYVVVAPSCGSVHATGRPWRLLQGGYCDIATITIDERRLLHDLARSFDHMPARAEPRTAQPPRQQEGELRPGDDYNNRVTWTEVLDRHGWQLRFDRGGVGYWRKPGSRDPGHHATTNHDGSDLLYVFSTATLFEPERGYSKFSAYTALEHAGDHEAAARALSERGYGQRKNPLLTRIEKRAARNQAEQDKTTDGDDKRPFTRIPLDLAAPVEPPRLIADWLYAACLTVLQSEPGVGKSWVAAWLTKTVLEAGHHVVYLDEEGGPELVRERLIALGVDPQLARTHLWYFAFEHRQWGTQDLEALDDLLYAIPGDIGLVVLDSLPDFLAAAGLDEDRAVDVTAFVARVCARFREIGAAQLLLDHLPKPPSEGKNKRSRYSRGSGAKLAKADATLLLETVAEFDATTSGRLRLWKTKDRRGRLPLPGLTKDPVVLDVTVGDGSLEIDPVGPAHVAPWDGPTECMAAVLAVLQTAPGQEFSKKQALIAVRAGGHQFRDTTVAEALARLALDGTAAFRRGARNAELYSWTNSRQDALGDEIEEEF